VITCKHTFWYFVISCLPYVMYKALKMDWFHPNHVAKAYKENISCVSNDDELFCVCVLKIVCNSIKQLIYICHVLRRNCLLKHFTEGKMEGRIEVTERREGRCKQLLDDLRDEKGCLKLIKKALDRSLWRTRSARSYGSVARQTTVSTMAPREFPVHHISCGCWRIFSPPFVSRKILHIFA